ncbi:hypothetical protein [Altericista sp. CCNU0014]|uniref:hypothetical protein n=1 Tax=Altericista sp. CCNU0014 TaxID=3082949 RepID=UPI00384F0F8A
MTIAADWLTIKVGTFLGSVPWRSETALASSSKTAELLDWRQLSVRGFFSNIAWDGRLLEFQTHTETPQDLSYLLPVQSFFSYFSWEGRPHIGAVPQLNVSQAKVPELSLNDLSDLF